MESTSAKPEPTSVALVTLCVDDRLDHRGIREQVRSKLQELGIRPDRILLLNEIGGNVGSDFPNAADLFLREGAKIEAGLVLHHDDCAAERAGRRSPMEYTLEAVRSVLAARGVYCPVIAGEVSTATGAIRWLSDSRKAGA